MNIQCRRRCVAAFTTLSLAVQGVRAQSVVVPIRAQTQPPPFGGLGESFCAQSAAQQAPIWTRTVGLYATREVGSARLLRALSFRPAHGSSSTAMTMDATIEMGMSALHPEDIVATSLDANYIASTRQVVFRGAVSLPGHSAGSWPTAFVSTITFAAPFAYAPSLGPSLVVDAGGPADRGTGVISRSWHIEYSYGDASEVAVALHQPDCLNSGGLASFTRMGRASFGHPGSALSLELWNYPAATPSLASNVLIVAPSFGGTLGNTPLPAPLATFGLPAAPTCRLALLPVSTVPMQYVDAGGLSRLSLTLPTPNDPGLAGAVFYTQNIALDVDAANTPRLFPSLTLRWRLGPATGMPAHAAFAWGAAARPDIGNLGFGGAPVLRLDG